MKNETRNPPFVALGNRLKGVPEVLTLGVKPNFYDYTSREQNLLLTAPFVLYPTRNYAQFFSTMGKRTFPSLETHLYADEKIKQTTLFLMLGLPHPRTRFYYRQHHLEILRDFKFPYIAKLPRASSQGRGVFLITGVEDLERYLDISKVAYIQEYLPHTRDLRVILINCEPVLAYWRVCPIGDFRANLAQGGSLSFKDIPDEALQLARESAWRCRFDDVGLDLIECEGKWYLIEANMKYGRKGLHMMGLDIKGIIREKLLSGELPGKREP